MVLREAEPNPKSQVSGKWKSGEDSRKTQCPMPNVHLTSRKWISSSRRREMCIGRRMETSSNNCIEREREPGILFRKSELQ